jgi:hypothetical protein
MKKALFLAAMTGVLLLLTASLASAAVARSSQSAAGASGPHRVGLDLGLYMPTGKFDDLDYKTGFATGVDYRYLLPSGFGFGAFLDYRAFSSKSISAGWGPFNASFKVDVDTIIVGPQALYEHRLANKLTLYGAGKLGYASTTMEAKAEFSTLYGGSYTRSASDDGSAFAAILEAGARYQLTRLIDLGVAAKYTFIPEQKVEGVKTNLSGLSLVALIGFNF